MGTDFLHPAARQWAPLGPAEQRFVLDALRGYELTGAADTIAWSTVTTRAVEDGIAPLLYRSLQTHPSSVAPDAVRDTLKRSYYQNLSANHIRLEELRRLGRLLGAHDIPLLVLKGGVLAQTVYADPAYRFMGDLDVAVPPEQADAALRLLQADGYTLHDDQERESTEATMKAYGWHVRLTRWVHGQQIELEFHWPRRRAVLVNQVAELDLHEMWRSALPLDETANLWQPAPAALLLHLCLHTGLQHRFSDLGVRHYLDLDRLVQRYGAEPGFWSAFAALARRGRAAHVSYFCLKLTAGLLGTTVPAAALHALQPPGWKRRLFAARFVPADAVNRTRALYGRRRFWWRLLTTDAPADLLLGPLRVLFPSRAFLTHYYGTDRPLRLLGYSLWHPFHALSLGAQRRLRDNRRRQLQPEQKS
jgi:hypothetical protein